VFVGTITQAPAHLIDNEYITGGYRINHFSFRAALSSLFSLHNESVNVWSHLLGMLFFAALIAYSGLFLASMSDVGNTVIQGFHSNKAQNPNIVSYFKD